MELWTWAQIKSKVQKDLKLEDEDFVDDEELLGYGNAAVRSAEKEITKLWDKYFEVFEHLPLVKGQSLYDLPDGIFANKITYIEYNDSGTIYEIKRIRDIRDASAYSSSNRYRYRPLNLRGEKGKLKLFPASAEDSSTNVTINYLRTANVLVDDDSVMDIPEALDYVIQHIKDSCRNNELGPMYTAPPSEALLYEKDQLIQTLSDMIPDEDNEVSYNLDSEYYTNMYFDEY